MSDRSRGNDLCKSIIDIAHRDHRKLIGRRPVRIRGEALRGFFDDRRSGRIADGDLLAGCLPDLLNQSIGRGGNGSIQGLRIVGCQHAGCAAERDDQALVATAGLAQSSPRIAGM